MARGTLALAMLALGAVLALPGLAAAQDLASDLFDETEPETVIAKVKASKKGSVRVTFTGSDPVDPVEDLTYDCAIDPGEGGDDEESGDEEDVDDGGDEGDDEERAGAAPSEIDCASPWTAKGLDPGRHVVEVIAFDWEYNEDPTPATAQFKVKKK